MGSFTSRDVCVQLFMKSENLRRDWNWSEDVKWRRVNRTPSSQLIGPSEDGGSGGVWLSRVTGSSVERFRPHPSQQQLADVLTDAVCLRCFWHTQLHTPAEKKKQNNKNVHMKVPQWRPRVGGADEDSDTERMLMLKWQSERFIFWDTTGKIGIVFYLFPVRIEEKLKKSYFPKVSELKTSSTLMNTLCFSDSLRKPPQKREDQLTPEQVAEEEWVFN